ncbi:MAG: SPASM domain-containing protein, partial [Promethearchaeota archaeon]|jgi:uncharacterized protein
MMGLKFFKKVVEIQTKYAPPNAIISNGLQTNGTLITNELAEFFAEYKFLLGVSLDGPEHLHDFYRKTIGLKPTHSQVIRGINHLKKHKVEFNILTLINDKNVEKASEIYSYFKEKGFLYQQYIPCVEFDKNGKLQPFSVTGEDWGEFLCDLFEQWIEEDITKVSIRLFDSILNYLVSGTYSVCYMSNNCCQYFVVEYDGSIYPCDFFVRKDLVLGNIKTHRWEDLLNFEAYHTFGDQKSRFNNRCKNCPFINLCHGDCQKNRFNSSNSQKALSILCKGWKRFYVNTLPRFKVLADQIKKNIEIDPTSQIKVKKIGRNALCPCNSGKKYKECCLR